MAGSLGDLLVRIGADIAGFEKAMGTVSSRLNAIDKEASKSLSGFDKLGTRLTDIGTTLTVGLTVPLAGIAIGAEQAAEGFQGSMNRVSALGEITGKALDDLREQALKLGADTVFSAKEAADGMAAFAGAGFKASEIADAMSGSLSLAAAGQMQVGEAAKLTADILGQFGLSANQAGVVADTLAKAGADAKASMSEMGMTLAYVGVPAKQMGMTMQETVASILALDKAAIRGERAGTGLRGVLASLVDPSKESRKELDALGISVADAGGNILPFSNIIEQFRTKLSAIGSEAERQRIVFQVFGREAGNAAMALINTGGPALDEFTRKLQDAGGAAETQAKVLQQGLPGAMEQLRGSVETAAIAIGTSLAPTIIQIADLLKTGADRVADFFQWFQKLPEPIKAAAIGITAAAAAIGPLAIGLGALISSFTTISGFIFTATGALTAFGGGIATAAAATVSFATVTIPAAISAVTTFATTTLPAAITALSLMAEIMIRDAVASVTAFARTAIPAAITALTTFATSTIPAAIGGLSTFATTTVPAATASLLTMARTGIAAAASALTTFATVTIPAAVSALGTLALTALPLIGVAAATAAAAFAGWNIGKWAYDAIPGVQALGDFLGNVFSKFEESLARLPGVSSVTERSFDQLSQKTVQLEQLASKLGVNIADLTEKYRNGQISLEQYNASLNNAVRAKLGAATASNTLDEAFKKLGITSSATLTKNVREAKAAVEEIEKAFKAGKASAEDLAKAKKALADITASLTPKVKSLEDQQKSLKDAVEKANLAYQNVARAYLDGKASAEQLEAAQIKLRAAQDAADPTQVLERSARAWEETTNRIEKDVNDYIAACTKLNEATKELERSNADLATTFAKAHETMRKESLETVKITVPMQQRIPEAVQDAVKANKELEDALKRTGQQSTKSADELWKAYDTISKAAENGKASPLQVAIAHREALKATIEEHRAAGKQIPEEWERTLEELERQTSDHGKKQKGIWQDMARQVSTIMSDLGKDIADSLFNMFKGNPENDRLRQEEADLRASLVTREQEWVDYQANVATQLEAIRQKHADELAQQEDDLIAALETKRQDYQAYVDDVTTQIEAIRAQHAEELQGEVEDLQNARRDKEAEYEEYRASVEERITEIRETHAEQLAEELSDLRDNLRDRTEEYEDFVSDVETKLQRTRVDYTDDVADERRSTDRKIADKRKAFSREEQDLTRKIANERAKGAKANQEQIREWQETLDQKRADTEEYIRREEEDYADFVEERRRRLTEQEQDLQESLKRRTRDHQQFLQENSNDQDAAVKKHRDAVDKQVGDLQDSLDARTRALEEFRQTTEAKIAAVTEAHRKKQEEEIANLREGLGRKTAEWEKYRADVALKLEAIREAAKIELAADEAKLQQDLKRAEAEWEKYKTDVNGKLAEIIDKISGPFDSIKKAFLDMFEDVGRAITRFGTEYLMGQLFKWLKKDLIDDILPTIASKFASIFTGLTGGSGWLTGTLEGANAGSGEGAPLPGGGGGGVAGAAKGWMGAINMASGIVSAVSDVFTAIGTYRLEGTMNAVEENTRYGMIHTLFLLDKANTFWPELKNIREFLWDAFMPAFASLMTTSETIRDMISGATPSVLGKGQTVTAPAVTMAADLTTPRTLMESFSEDILDTLRQINYHVERFTKLELHATINLDGRPIYDGLIDYLEPRTQGV